MKEAVQILYFVSEGSGHVSGRRLSDFIRVSGMKRREPPCTL
jgi:hypothetical protein